MYLTKLITLEKNQEIDFYNESLTGSNLFKQLDENSKEIALNLAKYLKYQQDNKHNPK